jgi:phosphoribosylanthranilate isomerase
MTRVKICGITNQDDALLSVQFGADALGFNFYRNSPRNIQPETAAEIIDKLPDSVMKVGVFVDESVENIVTIANVAGLGSIQLHGDETPEFIDDLRSKTNLEIIKAFRVSGDFSPRDVLRYDVDAILLDAYSPDEHGGTGKTFDWNTAKLFNCRSLYLAGGLSPENVADAIRTVRPFAVDACSCLEAGKGVKDPEKLRRFIENAKNA